MRKQNNFIFNCNEYVIYLIGSASYNPNNKHLATGKKVIFQYATQTGDTKFDPVRVRVYSKVDGK